MFAQHPSPTPLDAPDVSTTAAAMQRMVDGIVQRLDAAGIAYCLLRNRERIPLGLLEWSDLDILVSSTAHREQLVDLFADLNPTHIASYRDGLVAMFFPVEDIFLRVDFFHRDLEWRAAVYGESREILAHRWNDRGIMVASLVDQAVVVWLEKLLRQVSFKPRYESLITEAYRADPQMLRERLEHAVGTELAGQLIGFIESERLPESVSLSSACKRELWLRAVRRRPASTLTTFGRQAIGAVRRRVQSTGLDVVILGPDGSGKTTVSRTIASAPSRVVPYSEVVYQQPYYRVLPYIGTIESRLLRRPQRTYMDSSNPHGIPPLHPLPWLLYSAYYTVDIWLSELLWKRKRLANVILVLHDRHRMEVATDPRRYRYTGPMWLARFVARLAPRPDLVIVLDAPAEVIQARKQDVPFETTEKQRAAYRALASRLPHGHIVDGNRPIDDVVRDVLKVIADTTRERLAGRYGMTAAAGNGRPGTAEAGHGLWSVSTTTAPGTAGSVREGS